MCGLRRLERYNTLPVSRCGLPLKMSDDAVEVPIAVCDIGCAGG